MTEVRSASAILQELTLGNECALATPHLDARTHSKGITLLVRPTEMTAS